MIIKNRYLKKFFEAGADEIDVNTVVHITITPSKDANINDIYSVEQHLLDKYPDTNFDFHVNKQPG